jgi:hypothetical protein
VLGDASNALERLICDVEFESRGKKKHGGENLVRTKVRFTNAEKADLSLRQKTFPAVASPSWRIRFCRSNASPKKSQAEFLRPYCASHFHSLSGPGFSEPSFNGRDVTVPEWRAQFLAAVGAEGVAGLDPWRHFVNLLAWPSWLL